MFSKDFMFQTSSPCVSLRLCLPYPNHGRLHPRTLTSIEALLECEDLCVDVVNVRGSSIPHARNCGVSGTNVHVRQTNFAFDYYLSLDADIEFTVADVLALIRRDEPIVGGAYSMRGMDGHVAAGWFDSSTAEWRYVRDSDEGIIEVDWIGAGFTLVKREVFEQMDYPYYQERVVKYKNDSGQDCACFVGDDVGFCMAAKNAGYKIHVDCDVSPKHYLTFEGGSTMTVQERLKDLQEKAVSNKQVIEQLSSDLNTRYRLQERFMGAIEELSDILKEDAKESDGGNATSDVKDVKEGTSKK